MAGHFPMLRVKKIMKSSSEVENISKESTLLVTRAAELFVKILTKEAYSDSHKGKKLDYKSIANIVNQEDRYEFLREMIPHKITVDEYYQIMKGKCKDDSDVDLINGGCSDEEHGDEEEENENEGAKEQDSSSGSDSDVIMLE